MTFQSSETVLALQVQMRAVCSHCATSIAFMRAAQVSDRDISEMLIGGDIWVKGPPHWPHPAKRFGRGI